MKEVVKTGMKESERASLRISKDTRIRFTRYLALLTGELGEVISQDECLNYLLDRGELELLKAWDLQTRVSDMNEHRRALDESLKKRGIETSSR